MPAERVQEQLDRVRIDLQPPGWTGDGIAGEGVVRARRIVAPQGVLGRAVVAVIDRYPLVLDRRRPRDHHPVVLSLKELARVLDRAGVAPGDRVRWDVEYAFAGRALSVPVVYLGERGKGKVRCEDLTVELLLDCEQDGVHVALVALMDPRRRKRFPLRMATGYREARKQALGRVLEPLLEEEFRLVPASQFLRARDERRTNGVALAARFIAREDLATDEHLVAALRVCADSLDDARRRGLARPGATRRA